MRFETIETVVRPAADDFRRRFVDRRRPVVVAGAIEDWRARRVWSPEYLEHRFGDVRVRAYVMPDGRMKLDRQTGFLVEEMRVRDYVAHVREASPVRYYLRSGFATTLPELLDDIATPAYCRRGRRVRSNLWFAKAGTVSHLHFDLPHNLYAQVYGRKRFILFAPGESRRLYPSPWTSAHPHVARVDAERRDDPRYPRFRDARGHVCELGPGDMLYIPERWWHHARTLETSISANFWWCSVTTLPLAVLSDAYKRVRGLNI
jgi:hypothetical protein